MMKRTLVRFALLTGALGLATAAVSGCSGPSQKPLAILTPPSAPVAASPTTGTAASTPPSGSASGGPSTPQEARALYAYEGLVDEWVAASMSANYRDQGLGQYASGSALEEITQALLTEKNKGAFSKGSPVVTNISYSQMLPVADPTQVVITSCMSDASWLEYKDSDGSLYDNIPGGAHKTQLLAKDENGTWKIDQMAMSAVGSC